MLLYEAKVFVDFVPVYQVPEGFHEFGAVVLVVEVVGMFPNIQSHQDLEVRKYVDVVFFDLHDKRSSNAGMHG